MFGFRKKKRIPKKTPISKVEFDFLHKVVALLPSQFEYLKHQVNSNFLVFRSEMLLQEKGNISFHVDESLHNEYKNSNFPELAKLKNILVKNSNGSYSNIFIRLLDGNLWGYYVPDNINLSDLDFSDYDLSKFKVELYGSKEYEKVYSYFSHLSPNLIDQFDLKSSFQIVLNERKFYTIKSLGDGNYLAIDDNTAVYFLIHDEFEIDKVFDSLSSFFNSIESEKFDITTYYNNKFR